MKKFFFRLEKVLEQRRKKEEAAILAQERARQDCSKWEKTIQDTRSKLQATQNQQSSGTIDIQQVLQVAFYREQLIKQLSYQQRYLSRAKEILEIHRQETVKARRDCLVLEKLKEGQYQEYIYQIEKDDQKFIDELACQNYARR